MKLTSYDLGDGTASVSVENRVVLTVIEGSGGGGAVASVNGQTGVVVLTAADVSADAAGAASTAQTNAEAYTDSQITAEVARANAAYDAAGAAAAAQSASQPLDSDLTAIAALSTTAYGRNLLALADAAALRSTAGLGTAATSATTDFDAAGSAAAAQAASQPLDSDLTAIAALTTTAYGRAFLALADAAAARAALSLGSAALSASTDFDASGAAAAAQAYAIQRANHTGTQTMSTISDAGTAATKNVGTTAGTVAAGDDSRITGAAQKANNLSDLASAATARANLGLGTAATVNTGTSSGDVPLLSTGGVLPIARIATGTPDGTKFVRDDGTLAVPAGGGGGTSTATIWEKYQRASGLSYESVPRVLCSSGMSVASGVMQVAAIYLPSGCVVSNLSLFSSGAVSGPLNWWFNLMDQNRVQLAITADQTTTAWNANTLKTLAIATTAAGAASSFTTTYEGLYYIGCMVRFSSGSGSRIGFSTSGSALQGLAPILNGSTGSGMSTPPAFPYTAPAIAVGNGTMWCAVS